MTDYEKQKLDAIKYGVDATIVEHAGLLWVPHKELLDGGLCNLENFDVVQINRRWYELQHHIAPRSTSFPGGCWWIEEVSPDALALAIEDEWLRGAGE